MNAIINPPALLPLDIDGIPASMMSAARWAPWRAVWNPRGNKGKGKYEKIPHRVDRPAYGLSNQSTKGWTTFDKALAAYRSNPDKFAGLGYLITGDRVNGGAADVFAPGDLTGVDLDHCRDPATGEIADWAAEIIAKLDSYTEVSPSGTGLRVMVRAQLAEDAIDHGRGIEIYGGSTARFVTITGQRVPGSPAAVRPPPGNALEVLAAKYRRSRTEAEVEDLHLPPLLSAMDLPDLEDLDLPPHARNFLSGGAEPGKDRSSALFATSIALTEAGCTREQILSILESNEYAMEVALDHRRQDYDKALRYLWKDHCRNGAARAKELAEDRIASFDLLDDPAPAAPAMADEIADLLGDGAADAPASTVLDDFEVLLPEDEAPAAVPVRAEKFAISGAGEFASGPPQQWIIKGVLPKAEVGMIYGESTAGKSFIAMDMLGAIAQGLPWRGLKTRAGRVVLVVAEGLSGARGRLRAYAQHHGVDLNEIPFGIIGDVPSMLVRDDVKALAKQVKAWGGADVIVLDTLAQSSAGANENSGEDMGKVLAHCRALHRATGAMVLLVHHAGKDTSRGARGWSGLKGAMDVELEVTRHPLTGRTIRLSKSKDGEDGTAMGFKLHVVTIGEDEDGDPITSCVVEHSGAVAVAGPRVADVKGENERAICEVLTDYADLGATSIRTEDLIAAAAEKLEFDPAAGKKDRRKEVIKRSLKTLETKNLIINNGFEVTLAHPNVQNNAD